MTDLILYHGLASTCSKKVRIVLYEKGLPFESKLIDLAKREQKAPDYIALNPKGVVPTLVHRGKSIVESSVILEYLDDAFPEAPLRPEDPAARAEVRLWLRFSDEIAHSAVGPSTWKFMQRKIAEARAAGGVPAGRPPGGAPAAGGPPAGRPSAPFTEADVEASAERMDACAERLDAHLRERCWLVADRLTLADAALLPFAARIRNLRPDFVDAATRPGLVAWLARAEGRPAFDKAMSMADDPRAAGMPNI